MSGVRMKKTGEENSTLELACPGFQRIVRVKMGVAVRASKLRLNV